MPQHENDKEFSSISYSGATKVYKRLPQQNMWHNNNAEDLLRSINNCCHNTKMWHVPQWKITKRH